MLVTVAIQLGTSAGVAQIPLVVHGRVQDAVTRVPIVQARVLTLDDSTRSVLTDSTGAFAISVDNGSNISLLVDGFGYVADRFDLTMDVATRVTVLLLEPEPVEVAAIDVAAEAALATVLTQLERRRNLYPYSVQVYDGRIIAESTAYGSALAFLKARAPRINECGESRSGLCMGDRPAGFDLSGRGADGDGMQRVGRQAVDVCIDGIRTNMAVQELRTMSIDRLALLEVYWGGRGGVRAYSADYLNLMARMGGMYIPPVHSWGAEGNRC
jgi:hypothetical protein